MEQFLRKHNQPQLTWRGTAKSPVTIKENEHEILNLQKQNPQDQTVSLENSPKHVKGRGRSTV